MQDHEPNHVKLFETLEAMQACLVRNEHRNLIFFPRERSEIDGFGADYLAKSIEANTSMVALTIEEVIFSSPGGIRRLAEALLQHSNFQRLTMHDNELGNGGVYALMNAMTDVFSQQHTALCGSPSNRSCISLQALCLCGNRIGDRGAYWISQALLFSTNSVKELDLSSNEITNQGVICLAEMMGRCNLTTFILNGNQASIKGAMALSKAMKKNSGLAVLGLCGNDIQDEGAIPISHVAKTHPSLKALLLEENRIGERGLMAVADAYRNNPGLAVMEISRNGIGTSSMPIQIMSASIENVIYLYLDHCELGDHHMEVLAKGLNFNHSTKDLFLEGNHFGFKGAKSLAHSLTVNVTLEGVFLDGNRITKAGAEILRDVLKSSNMRLKRLQIHDDYHEIQREMDVYLDMNGAGRQTVLESSFPASLWSEFLVQKDDLCDTDMIYLFLRERPEFFLQQPQQSAVTYCANRELPLVR